MNTTGPMPRILTACVLFTTVISQPALADSTLTETLTTQPLPIRFELDATIEAVNQSTVSAQTRGAIKAIYFDVNNRVEAGALLLEIDNTQQQAGLSQAKANFSQAVAQNEDAQVLLKRNRRLFKKGTVSQGELDSTTARAKSAAAAVSAARALVKQAEEQLAYTKVRAPYSGIVRSRHVEIGEFVNPGKPLMTGLSLEELRAVADAPQRLANQYQSADQIRVRVNDKELQPTNVTVFPYADASLHSVRLRADLPANTNNLIPGMWAKVVMTTGQRDAITVPASAVIHRSELSAVYTQRHGQAVLRQVRVGNPQGERVEILAGLSAGDVIYINGYDQMAAQSSGAE